MDYLNSLFIDDEMTLEDKISFVRHLKHAPSAADEALYLLKQETLIRGEVITQMPETAFAPSTTWKRIREFVAQPKRLVLGSLAAALAVLMLFL